MAGTVPTFAGQILGLMLNGTAIASPSLAMNETTSPLTNLYIALHTADPTSGNQSTSEISYTGYARVAIVRTGSGWTITSNVASPASAITWATTPSTGVTTQTASFFSIGTALSGTGVVLWVGSVSPTIGITNSVTPTLTTSSTITLT